MKIKKWNQFNEEISRKGLIGGVLAGTLAIGGGGSYMRDKSSAPTEQSSSIKKELPNQFMINQKLLSMGSDFWVTSQSRENFGKIEERLISWGKKFEYFDNTGKLEAYADARVFSIGSKVDVYDESGNQIGRIEEEILESLGNILEGQNIYSIYDGGDNLIGKSKADQIIRNQVEIFDTNGNLIAKFHKPWIQISDRWSCEITGDIDKRLLIFIPAYLSSKSSSSSSSSKRK